MALTTVECVELLRLRKAKAERIAHVAAEAKHTKAEADDHRLLRGLRGDTS